MTATTTMTWTKNSDGTRSSDCGTYWAEADGKTKRWHLYAIHGGQVTDKSLSWGALTQLAEEKADEFAIPPLPTDEEEANDKVTPDDTNTITWDLIPTVENWASGDVLVWLSEDIRYRIVRRGDGEFTTAQYDGSAWRYVETHLRLGPGYPNAVKTLRAAFQQVERFHANKFGAEPRTNCEEALEKWDASADNTSVETSTNSTEEEEIVMVVQEKAARALFTSLGYDKQADWDLKKITKRLNSRNKPEEGEHELTGELLELDNAIKAGLDAGEEIEVEADSGDGLDEGEVKPATRKVTKMKGKPSKNGESKIKTGRKAETPAEKAAEAALAKARAKVGVKKTKANTSNGEVDKFGSRIGSNRAAINAQLTSKPKTIEELAKGAGIESLFFRKHLKALCEQKHITKEGNGYRLASKK
jgi:hypothetical protein